MIIPSPLIVLDYNPVKDILTVEWPDVQNHSLTEVKHCLREILNTIRFYDVKNLLIDARNTVAGVEKEEYHRTATNFVKDLHSTRLKKVARIESSNRERELQVKGIVLSKFTINFRNFSDTTEALAWLEAAN